MNSSLPESVVDAMLERLGVERPNADIDGLATIYGAWCRAVPFDNALCRVELSGRASGTVLPGLPAESFVSTYLEHGAGGMCVPTTQALHALLRMLGFESERAVASIAGGGATAPNHVTLVVRVQGGEYVLDTTILCEHPVPLRPHVRPDPLHPVMVERVGSRWRVRYLSAALRGEERCTVLERVADSRSLAGMYRQTQQSATFARFNRSLYIRRNVKGGALVLIGNQLFQVDGHGEVTATDVSNRRVAVLTERFGLSVALAERIPPESRQVNRALDDLASLLRVKRPAWARCCMAPSVNELRVPRCVSDVTLNRFGIRQACS